MSSVGKEEWVQKEAKVDAEAATWVADVGKHLDEEAQKAFFRAMLQRLRVVQRKQIEDSTTAFPPPILDSSDTKTQLEAIPKRLRLHWSLDSKTASWHATGAPLQLPDQQTCVWWRSKWHGRLALLLQSLVPGSVVQFVGNDDELRHMEAMAGHSRLAVPDPSSMLMLRGVAQECHDNCFKLHSKGKIDLLFSGFALADDGVWQYHSWGIQLSTPTATTGRWVETTSAHLVYVGHSLQDHST
jgi:hypothetical protein